MCTTIKPVGYNKLVVYTKVEHGSTSSNKLDGVIGVNGKLKLVYGSSRIQL